MKAGIVRRFGVVEVGSAVTDLQEGQRVVLLPMLVCGSCAACESGVDSGCRGPRFLGEHTDGTYAESSEAAVVWAAPP